MLAGPLKLRDDCHMLQCSVPVWAAGVLGCLVSWPHWHTSLPRLAPLPAGMAVRQQHFANGSVLLLVDALLLPPPLSAGEGGLEADEGGELALEVVSSDGQQRWRAQAAVSVGPEPTEAGASGPGSSESGSSSGAGSGTCPWASPESSSSSSSSGSDAEEAAAAAAPQPQTVKRSISVLLEAPELWWPHDLGQQPLYDLQLTYSPSSGASGGASGVGGSAAPAAEAGSGGSGPAAESGGAAAANDGSVADGGSGSSARLRRRIGLRTVELVTDRLPGSAGETFFFRVNGQPLYARGTASVWPALCAGAACVPSHVDTV